MENFTKPKVVYDGDKEEDIVQDSLTSHDLSAKQPSFKVKLAIILAVVLLVIIGLGGWWYYAQGAAMILAKQATWKWGYDFVSYNTETKVSLGISNIEFSDEEYNQFLPFKDLSVVVDTDHYANANNFSGNSSINVSSDDKDLNVEAKYKRVGDNFYLKPTVDGLESFLPGQILGIKEGQPYTTVSFSYSDALHDPDHNNGLSEDAIFDMYDYLIMGDYTWDAVVNDYNKSKVFMYLDIWGKDTDVFSDKHIIPAPPYYVTENFPEGHGSIPSDVKQNGSPYSYIQTDEYFEDLTNSIDIWLGELQEQGISIAGFFLDDWGHAALWWDDDMTEENMDKAWPGRGHTREEQDDWYVNEQYPRMLKFEEDLHDILVKYYGYSDIITNGSARRFRDLLDGTKEPYYYNNPDYTPNKITRRAFEGPTMDANHYVNFPEMLLDINDEDYKYYRAWYPKDLLLMYSIAGDVDGQNGSYGDWVDDPPYNGELDWATAVELAYNSGPDAMLALEYGSYPITGGTWLALFTDPSQWPYMDDFLANDIDSVIPEEIDISNKWLHWSTENWTTNTDQDAIEAINERLNQLIIRSREANLFKISDTHQSKDTVDGKLKQIKFMIKPGMSEELVGIIIDLYPEEQKEDFRKGFEEYKKSQPEMWQDMQELVEQVEFYLWVNTETKNIQGIDVMINNYNFSSEQFSATYNYQISYLMTAAEEKEIVAPTELIDWETYFGYFMMQMFGNSMYFDNPNTRDNDDFMPDSDGDGLTDHEESYWNTDPLNPDTDGDGYTDQEEVSNGYNPNGEGKLEF